LSLEALNESGVFPAPNEASLERVLDFKNMSKQQLQAQTAKDKLNLMLIRG